MTPDDTPPPPVKTKRPLQLRDTDGRPYLTPAQAREDLPVVTDGDFTCIVPWTRHRLRVTPDGEFYVPCRCGGHELSGQLNATSTTYVGVYAAATIPPPLLAALHQQAKLGKEPLSK